MNQAVESKIAELASDLTDAEAQHVNEVQFQATTLTNTTTFVEATRDEKITEFVEAFRHTLGIVSQRDGKVTIVKPLVCETQELEDGATSLKGTISYAQKRGETQTTQA